VWKNGLDLKEFKLFSGFAPIRSAESLANARTGPEGHSMFHPDVVVLQRGEAVISVTGPLGNDVVAPPLVFSSQRWHSGRVQLTRLKSSICRPACGNFRPEPAGPLRTAQLDAEKVTAAFVRIGQPGSRSAPGAS